jgi:hypothetical protein
MRTATQPSNNTPIQNPNSTVPQKLPESDTGQRSSNLFPVSDLDIFEPEKHPSQRSIEELRSANRRVARQTPAEERLELYSRHKQLMIKKFTDGLSTAEERELVLLRWNLDRIEDAETGEHLDYLEAVAESAERITKEIASLVTKAGTISSQNQTRNRK